MQQSFQFIYIRDENRSAYEHQNILNISDEKCTVQGGKEGKCVIYSQCRPLLELLSNLQQPLPSEIPSLMQSSILCGREEVNGRSLPKVCCPTGAINLSEEEK